MAHRSKDLPKKKRIIWLIGGTLEKLSGCKLPSNHQVLCRFFHLHLFEKKTVQESATMTAKEIAVFLGNGKDSYSA